jgi:hypothetical protein
MQPQPQVPPTNSKRQRRKTPGQTNAKCSEQPKPWQKQRHHTRLSQKATQRPKAKQRPQAGTPKHIKILQQSSQIQSQNSRRIVKRFVRRYAKFLHTHNAIDTPTAHPHPLVSQQRTQSKHNSIRKHGFWCNPRLPLWAGVTLVLSKMPIAQFHKLSTHHQTAYHNLCTSKDPPPGVDKLLWNGLKFCLQKPLPKPNIDSTCLRLTEDVRRKHFWSTHGDGDNSDYNPKLYIRSQWTAPEAPPPLELALQNFQTALHQQTRDNLSAQPRQHNLPASHRKLLQELSNNKDFTITATDKNLGPAILERSVYKQRCLSDHLEDKNTYQRLAPDDVTL